MWNYVIGSSRDAETSILVWYDHSNGNQMDNTPYAWEYNTFRENISASAPHMKQYLANTKQETCCSLCVK